MDTEKAGMLISVISTTLAVLDYAGVNRKVDKILQKIHKYLIFPLFLEKDLLFSTTIEVSKNCSHSLFHEKTVRSEKSDIFVTYYTGDALKEREAHCEFLIKNQRVVDALWYYSPGTFYIIKGVLKSSSTPAYKIGVVLGISAKILNWIAVFTFLLGLIVQSEISHFSILFLIFNSLFHPLVGLISAVISLFLVWILYIIYGASAVLNTPSKSAFSLICLIITNLGLGISVYPKYF